MQRLLLPKSLDAIEQERRNFGFRLLKSVRGDFLLPSLGRSLLFSTGYPPPPFVCKIQKTSDLYFDYMLDL